VSKPIVAIVGRPNVGKSTLFNRMIKKRMAIVEDRPGVTRDRLYAECLWNRLDFLLVDTGGFIPRSAEKITSLVSQQVQLAIDQSDLVVFLVDTRVGFQNIDQEIAAILKRAGKKVIVAANKSDSAHHIPDSAEFYKLGLGEVYPVSAASGLNVAELMDAIVEKFETSDVDDTTDDILKVAIVGRPNVGKSSLFNSIIGEDRQIVSDMPGTTRDSIDSLIEIDNKTYRFIDTAGLRHKARYPDIIEYFSSLRSLRAIDRADIVLAVIDCGRGITNGDIRIAATAAEMKRGLIFIANKWDLVKNVEQYAFIRDLHEKAPLLRYVDVLFTNAITGKGTDKIINTVNGVENELQKRISTARLNGFIRDVVAAKHPPAKGVKFIKFYYVTQAESKPPTFVIFCNHPRLLDKPYRRYLENRLRDEYGFKGCPLTVYFKSRN